MSTVANVISLYTVAANYFSEGDVKSKKDEPIADAQQTRVAAKLALAEGMMSICPQINRVFKKTAPCDPFIPTNKYIDLAAELDALRKEQRVLSKNM